MRATPNTKPGPVRRPRQRHSATLPGCASGTVPQFEWTKSRGPVIYYSGHGDLAAETNSSGTRTTDHTYDPFGAPLDTPPANATAHRYTGAWDKQNDSTNGLVLMGARLYDPGLGRFLTTDPIQGGSLNNYDYAGQDPINGYDLSGRMAREEPEPEGFIREPAGTGRVDDIDGVITGEYDTTVETRSGPVGVSAHVEAEGATVKVNRVGIYGLNPGEVGPKSVGVRPFLSLMRGFLKSAADAGFDRAEFDYYRAPPGGGPGRWVHREVDLAPYK
jgi:RHS repeat-associated protein